jgi:DNA-binding transcriptional LysR family regulator
MALCNAVHGGAGLGILPEFMAGGELVRLLDGDALPQRDLWVAMHEDLRHWPPARAVIEHLHQVTAHFLGDQGAARAQRNPSS